MFTSSGRKFRPGSGTPYNVLHSEMNLIVWISPEKSQMRPETSLKKTACLWARNGFDNHFLQSLQTARYWQRDLAGSKGKICSFTMSAILGQSFLCLEFILSRFQPSGQSTLDFRDNLLEVHEAGCTQILDGIISVNYKSSIHVDKHRIIHQSISQVTCPKINKRISFRS